MLRSAESSDRRGSPGQSGCSPLCSPGGAWWLLQWRALGSQAGPGMGHMEVCALDPSSLCCLCPGGSTMDSSAGGKARPEAGEDKEGLLSKLKKMFTS